MKHATTALMIILLAGTCVGDSLYTDGSFFGSMYSDRKAAKAGDVLHILVRENAQATQTASRNLHKDTDVSVGPGIGWMDFLPLNGYSGSSGYDAGATANRSGSMQVRLTVRVKEVLPGGNLLVEGCRKVRVNKDIQEIVFSGTVRPEDIRADNTIYSYDVADLNIDYQGSDPSRPGQKTGIITRVLNWLF